MGLGALFEPVLVLAGPSRSTHGIVVKASSVDDGGDLPGTGIVKEALTDVVIILNTTPTVKFVGTHTHHLLSPFPCLLPLPRCLLPSPLGREGSKKDQRKQTCARAISSLARYVFKVPTPFSFFQTHTPLEPPPTLHPPPTHPSPPSLTSTPGRG